MIRCFCSGDVARVPRIQRVHSLPLLKGIAPFPPSQGTSPLISSRRHRTCHFRKRATSAPAEGPAYGLDHTCGGCGRLRVWGPAPHPLRGSPLPLPPLLGIRIRTSKLSRAVRRNSSKNSILFSCFLCRAGEPATRHTARGGTRSVLETSIGKKTGKTCSSDLK